MILPVTRRFSLRSYSVSAALFLFIAVVAPAQESAAPPSVGETHGIAIANMDPSVKPGDNFYLYANGGWIARTEIPADRAGLSVFSVLLDRSNKEVASIIEDAAKSRPPVGFERPQDCRCLQRVHG